ncbi:MAG: clostripain-related cysteine peptidase [Flavobacteriales bacterium]|nr:clostripain-related cysteine peptidase [Flavobacteriales bacterium]
MKKILFLLLSAAILSGCSKSPKEPTERTVLVYLAAKNNLSSYAEKNLYDMQTAYKNNPPQGNVALVVYLDIPGQNPTLYRVDKNGLHSVKQYSDINSTSASTIKTVISDVITMFPAKSYGLDLWSHGTGWAPQGFPLLTKSKAYSTAQSFGTVYPPTKTFGSQYYSGALYEIEIADLVNAIPSSVFDYIIFDACYMGAVEVAYALKDKTDYVVSSSCEVLAYGFPYDIILSDMFPTSSVESSMKSLSEKYFNYYAQNSSSSLRAATVSLINTSKMDNLATSVRNIVKGNTNVGSITPSQMQKLDLYSYSFMYDLNSFIEKVATTEQYQQFNAALSSAVPYSAHTPYFFSLKIDTFCVCPVMYQ